VIVRLLELIHEALRDEVVLSKRYLSLTSVPYRPC
jgi:hypothetical protein